MHNKYQIHYCTSQELSAKSLETNQLHIQWPKLCEFRWKKNREHQSCNSSQNQGRKSSTEMKQIFDGSSNIGWIWNSSNSLINTRKTADVYHVRKNSKRKWLCTKRICKWCKNWHLRSRKQANCQVWLLWLM